MLTVQSLLESFENRDFDTSYGNIKIKDMEFYSQLIELTQTHDPEAEHIKPAFIVAVVQLHRKFMDS